MVYCLCTDWDWEGYHIVSCIGFSCEIYGGQFIFGLAQVAI